jgi:MFS family permease
MFFRSLGRYRGLPKEIYVLFVSRVVNSLGAFVHPLLTMILTTKLGMAEGEAGTFITILMATQMPIMLVGGKLADKFGRRRLIIVFQFLGALTYIVCGLVPISGVTPYLIMAASYFYALTFPALEAVTMDLTNGDQRKEAYALLYMGFNLGFVFGPMIGGMMMENHLPLLFIGDGLTTIISTVLFMIFIRETLPKKGEKERPELEKYVDESVFSVLWKRKIIIVFALIMMVIQFVYSQWGFALPLQIEQLFGDTATYGFIASFNGLLVILLTPLVTPFVRRTRALTGTLAGGLMYAAAFAMLIVVKELYLFYISMFIFTLGEVIMTIDAGVFVAGILPSSHRGRIDSIYSSITSMGRVMSPMVIGWVITASSLSFAWVVLTGTAVFGCVMLLALIRSRTGRKQIGIVSGHSVSE